PDTEDAVHLVFLRPGAGGAIRLGVAPAHSRAQGLVPLPEEDRFLQRRARHGARRGSTAGVPFRRLAVFLVACVSAREYPDLPAVHLHRPDCPAALALEGTS